MITDTPELRRLLFIAQQRRWRYVSIHIPIATLDDGGANERALDAADDARLALHYATAALMDYLQAQVDGGDDG